jgi:large subunit ribosomal protein L23
MNTPFDILRRPLVTEKSTYLATKLHQYVFEVPSKCTRTEVKEAVEKVFNVTVLKINIINLPGKQSHSSRNRRLRVRKPGYKKAVVTLTAEDRIPLFEGVEQ